MTFVKLFQLTIINQNCVLMENGKVWGMKREMRIKGDEKEKVQFSSVQMLATSMTLLWCLHHFSLSPYMLWTFFRFFFTFRVFYAELRPLAEKIAYIRRQLLWREMGFAQTTKMTSKLAEKKWRAQHWKSRLLRLSHVASIFSSFHSAPKMKLCRRLCVGCTGHLWNEDLFHSRFEIIEWHRTTFCCRFRSECQSSLVFSSIE